MLIEITFEGNMKKLLTKGHCGDEMCGCYSKLGLIKATFLLLSIYRCSNHVL